MNCMLSTRYYKSHLFTEARMFDPLPRAQRQLDSALFSLPVNTPSQLTNDKSPPSTASASSISSTTWSSLPVGLMTCFDVEFGYPSQPLTAQLGVRHFLLSSWWVNTLPLFHAAAFQQAFARVSASLLVAANSGRLAASGGGIWDADGRPITWWVFRMLLTLFAIWLI